MNNQDENAWVREFEHLSNMQEQQEKPVFFDRFHKSRLEKIEKSKRKFEGVRNEINDQ